MTDVEIHIDSEADFGSEFVGLYKLLQPLREGGMRLVHMAGQKEPIRRRVTLKVIKSGMDTRQAITCETVFSRELRADY